MLFLRRPTAETIQAFLAAQARLNLTYAAVGATTTALPAGYAVYRTGPVHRPVVAQRLPHRGRGQRGRPGAALWLRLRDAARPCRERGGTLLG